VTFDHMR